jgi:glycosyltransferase involved in cell wall biosynthesis
MASGVPVLTTSTNGAAELIKDGKNGFVVRDPLDAAGIGRRVLEFSLSSDRTLMGERARQAVLSLDWDSVLTRMLKIYEEIRG